MNDEQRQSVTFAEFEIDVHKRRLLREGKPLAMNAKTFDLLAFLVENNGRTVTKDEVLEAVWPGQFVEEANLSVQISALRKVLGESKNEPRFLVTVPGKGYKFVADVNDGDSDEIFIENHKIEHIIIDEERESSQIAEAVPPAGKKRPSRKAFYAVVLAAGISISLLVFGGYRFLSGSDRRPVNSIAVLPFVHQNNDPNSEFLSEGLAESVIYSLSSIPELRVMSRNSSFRFKGAEADPKTVGRELNVEAILTGRIAQSGENLSISTELVSTRDNSVIWGEQFTRRVTDVEKLQTDIAQSISQRLRLKLSGAAEERLQKNQSGSPEVYRLYLLGRYHSNKLTDEGFWRGRDYFEQAIEKDPHYAPAYAGLAEAYNRLCGYNALPPNECFPKARQAAARALELDDQLAEAHAALGAVKHFYDWDWPGAEKEFKLAIRINPNNAEAHYMYGLYLLALERFDEAYREMKLAQELDPLSIEKIIGIGEVFYFQGRYDQAIEQYRKGLEMDPDSGFVYWAIGRTMTDKKMFGEAIAALQKSIPLSGGSPDELVELGRAHALAGNRDEALKIVEELKLLQERKYVSPATISSIYAALGDHTEAFLWLEDAYKRKDFLMVLLKVEPMFDPLRSAPEFAELVRRVGLPQ